MTLIADSGSTKTMWGLSLEGTPLREVTTGGLNPYLRDERSILALLREELLPQLGGEAVGDVFFYGAGCREETLPLMHRLLKDALCPTGRIEVASDLLGSARALLGHDKGIAAILGTGANSGLYDGARILQSIPPLGYVLGDEGSGAVLGRMLVGAAAKGLLSERLCKAFFLETGLSLSRILERVYHAPQPSRFLAGLVPFAVRHREDREIRSLLVSNFKSFFLRNIRPYNHPELNVHFVGSIAYGFERELREAAQETGFRVGRIVRYPLERLADYHR